MITVTSAEWGHIEVAPAIAVVALDHPPVAVAALLVSHVTTARNRHGPVRASATQIGARYRPEKMMTPGSVRTAATGTYVLSDTVCSSYAPGRHQPPVPDSLRLELPSHAPGTRLR